MEVPVKLFSNSTARSFFLGVKFWRTCVFQKNQVVGMSSCPNVPGADVGIVVLRGCGIVTIKRARGEVWIKPG